MESTPHACANTPQRHTFRRRLNRWLLDPHAPGSIQAPLHQLITTLVVMNLISLIFEYGTAIYASYSGFFNGLELFCTFFFCVEFVLRVYLAPEQPSFSNYRFARMRYLISATAIIDFLALLPFFVSAAAGFEVHLLWLLRLFRLLKLGQAIAPAMHEFRVANQHRSFKQRVYSLLHLDEFSGTLHRYIDQLIVWCVLTSVIAIVLESVDSIHTPNRHAFMVLDVTLVALFAVEYVLRMYCCTADRHYADPVLGRIRYFFSPNALIDFLALVPFLMELFFHQFLDLRFLRVFRILRVFKLTRYTASLSTLQKVVARESGILYTAGFIMLLLVILTAALGFLFEHEAQPDKFENIPQSIYWATITLASVGYGDLSPITPWGRTLTVIISILGIAIFALPAGILASAFTDQLRMDREDFEERVKRLLADGEISADDRAVLRVEAERLHIGHRFESTLRKLAEERTLRLREQAEADRALEEHLKHAFAELLEESHSTPQAAAAAQATQLGALLLHLRRTVEEARQLSDQDSIDQWQTKLKMLNPTSQELAAFTALLQTLRQARS